MTTAVGTRIWQLYEYPTVMRCASGQACPLGGVHALYGGMSNLPAMRDRQHERCAPWWGHRSGPQRVLPGEYYSEADAKAAESLMIASGRYLANIDENRDNPCRWYFGPPVDRRQPHIPRITSRWQRIRRRSARRRRKATRPMIRKALWTLGIFSLVMFVVRSPAPAAQAVKTVAGGIAIFFTTLFT